MPSPTWQIVEEFPRRAINYYCKTTVFRLWLDRQLAVIKEALGIAQAN
ncbi:hypothetical protein IFO70_32800 [Phormidium tenue FACHB-886]|nr:hypothetical protein [Phormidium tenue FACHB-886]